MILEIWHIIILILFVVACVVINYTTGLRKGIEITLFGLQQSGIINVEVKDDRIIIKSRHGKDIKSVDAIDIIK